jgi:hypothetical protein
MKRFITVLILFGVTYANNSLALAIPRPVFPNDKTISLGSMKASEFAKLSAEDYSSITGKEMNLWNRISFSFLKMRIKHDIKNNPNLTICEYYSKNKKHMSPWLWIAIGLVVILVILLAAGLTVYG